jgi:hypothetical protein
MKITVDLSEEKFDDYNTITFYDSKTIFFEPTNILPSTVSFKVWGAGLMPGFEIEKYVTSENLERIKKVISKSSGNETTIQGFGTLTFEKVLAGNISIHPYDKGTFLKDKSGNEIVYKREWKLEDINDDCYVYLLDTSIYFP